MAHIVLGATPDELEVVLTRNASFFTTLITEDGTPWPVNIIIRLILGASEFDATIIGAEASFNIPKATVNQLIADRVKTAELFYIDGSNDIPWAVGVVNANG
jgi:hypothetical protein